MIEASMCADAAANGLDEDKLEALALRARREVDEGILPATQIAIARNGRLLWQRSFGAAQDDSLFCVFSATKGVTAAGIWLLLQAGELDLETKAASLVPEFASNGKDVITLKHLLTHTAGFPHAPFRPSDWTDKDKRYSRFNTWRLTFEPGTQFEYHPSSSNWVLAEMIERVTGRDFRDYLRDEVLAPLGLHDFYVGLRDETVLPRVLPCGHAGDPLTSEDYKKLGMPEPPETEVTEEAILSFNRPDVLAVGVPGGGGVCGAGELAMFYQGLLHGGKDGKRLWSQETMTAARTVHSGDLTDPMFRKPANRGLGLIISGGDDRSFRGFGKTNSPQAFGHNGAGGQLAWADPATGLSLGYVTNGHDRNPIRQGRRGVAISSLAATLLR